MAAVQETRYLVIGASHAGLEAVTAIRHHDLEGSLTLISRESHPSYSPTLLPYVVSGRAQANRTALRPESWFAEHRVTLHRGETLVAVDAAQSLARMASGAVWHFEKLLLATGAIPSLPPLPGLETVPFHVLRTLDDALALKSAATDRSRRAIVLGAGLVGLHGAENLLHAGLPVSVIERAAQVLPGYLDPPAAAMVAKAFHDHGARLYFGRTAAAVSRGGTGSGATPSFPETFTLTLDDGQTLEGELLLVATGVQPNLAFLAGSGLLIRHGIVVDARMQTSAPGIWAAGDVAETGAFLDPHPRIGGILPDAVEQGRTAGMAMAGDPALKPYPGSLPVNTYGFFGRHAVSVGDDGGNGAGTETIIHHDPVAGTWLRIALENNRLRGVCAVDVPVDAGVLWQLIRRRLDLGPVRSAFCADPLTTGRHLMARYWQ